MNEQQILLAFGGIGIAALGCQWLAWRLKLPAILFLLLAGILLGPVLGWLNPQTLFGPLLMPLVSLAVALILFEGSLTLHLSEWRGIGTVVRHFDAGYRADGHCADAARGAAQGVDCEHFALGRDRH